MNYEYKIMNVDPSSAFVKRVLLYIAILTITVSLALIVLFILFERYLALIIPIVLIVVSLAVIFLIGRKVAIYEYSFTDTSLIVRGGRENHSFDLNKIAIDKNAENSDYFNKNIIKLSFIHNRIVVKSAINDNTFSVENCIFRYEDKVYLVGIDDYALAILKGAKDEI